MNNREYSIMKRAAGLMILLMPFLTVSLSAQTPPVATYPVVVGEARPGMIIWASYVYNDDDLDPQGSTVYQWFTASDQVGNDTIRIPSATGKSYKVQDPEGSWLGFYVIPVDDTGDQGGKAMTPVFIKVTANEAPVAQNLNITGTFNVGDVLTGHYTYSDYEGDIESGTEYKWYRSLNKGDQGSVIPLATGISYQITMDDDQRMYFTFSVKPKAATFTDSNTEYLSPQTNSKANSAPYATNVYISGSKIKGEPLTGHYDYNDDDPTDHEDLGATIFQWYRGSEQIYGATEKTYYPGHDDVGRFLVFKVSPVTAGTGNPIVGEEEESSSFGPITDPASGPPTATQLCIDGIREEGKKLKGRYLYSNDYDEDNSLYLWYADDDIVDSSRYDSSKGYATYKLKDTVIGKRITFAVIPQNEIGIKGDIAFSPPLAIFTLPRDVFSETDPAQLLIADPPGGIFSGVEVSGNYFYPERAGSSDDPYKLTYILPISSDDPQCNQTAYKNVWVRPIVVEFSGLDPIYCDNHGPVTVYVLNVPETAGACTFKITDPKGIVTTLTTVADTSTVFNPDTLSPDDGYIISCLYVDGGSDYTLQQYFTVDHIGEVSIGNLKPDTTFCGNIEPFPLYTSHAGGIFTGPVKDKKLDFSSFPEGYGDTLVTVTYTITTALGCSRAAVVPMKVFPVPNVSFFPEDYCILDINSDSTRMINHTTSKDPVKSWLWEFSEAGLTSYDTSRAPAYLYRTGGFHKIFLTATTINDCFTRKPETFDIGVKPIADFYWKNECFHADDSIYFFDATISTSKIMSRSWNFFDGDSPHTIMNPPYQQKSIGYLPVEYIVTTGYEGCDDSIFRKVYIRPTIKLAEDDYFEDFEGGKGGWVRDYETVNNWKFGTPGRNVINNAASGDSAWYTGFRIDTTVFESSSIISPCFDFTSIERPMISLELWKRFDKNSQGAVLQYKIGDTPSWEYVGTLDDGINWYNSALIKGRPGGGNMGWTSYTEEIRWHNARHKLDGLQNKKDVKFRLAYGSDGNSVGFDGIAFDDIWIGSRTRKVLVEHFANTSTDKSREATGMVNDIVLNDTMDIINIQYHTNFPGVDSFYVDNPGDASARILYYGLARAPYTFLDGGNDLPNYASLFDYHLSSIDNNEIIRRSLINPLFNIDLNSDISGGILTINGQIKALTDTTIKENMTLYLAITEKETDKHPGTNGETVFYNVFRKMIPDAGGINLKKNWSKDETIPIPSQSWLIENIGNNSDIEVIAFLQNNITKAVYQAVSQLKPDIGVGIEETPGARGIDFSIYPNPAVNKLTLAFKEPLLRDALVKIYDMRGIVISTYKAGSGVSEYTADNLNLKSGIYMVRVSAGGFDLGFRKLVISGR